MTDNPKRWLADYKVESELRLVPEEKKITYIHPDNKFEVHISNASKDTQDNEVLSVQIILLAPNIQAAESETELQIEKFLHLLSFITNTGYKISRRIRVVDWSKGLREREMFVYSNKLSRNAIEGLNSELLNTAHMLHGWGTSPMLERALRWFAAGIKSRVMEDQIQFFWFVVELIASATKGNEKVADKCPKCQGDLFCQTCEEISKHKPFPKQAIAQLLSKINVSDDHIDDLFEVRNSLMHGDTREMIETEIQKRHPDFALNKVVDLLGQCAWAIILNNFPKPAGKHQPAFLTVNSYVDWHMIGKAHMILGMGGDPNDPKIENLSLPQVTLK